MKLRWTRARRGRSSIRTAAAVAAAALALTACSGSGSDGETGTGEEPAAGEEQGDDGEQAAETGEVDGPIEGRPEPVANDTGEPVRIAMIGFANNPYWVVVESGVQAADQVLSEQDAEVDWIVAGATIDVPTVNAAVRAAGAQGYDGIGFFIAGEGNCSTISELSGQGLALGTYNTLFDCVEESGGVIAYAQEQYQAGQDAAAALLEELGPDASGSVGIITSSFTAPGAEQRRTGFLDGIEGSGLTPVNEGVEANDSASDTFTAAQNFINSNDDLVAIYATAGGPFGAAEAVAEAGVEDQVKVIGFDITEENIAAIENGSMWGVTGQDAFGQGYNVAVELYNAVVTGEPADPVLQPAVSPFVTAENLDEHDPSQQPLGTVGTS